MCRLFAYKTENPEKDNELLISSLIEFRELSQKGCVPCGIAPGHNDGWGIVAYKNGSPFFYTRSTQSAMGDSSFDKSLNIIESCKPDIVIAHLRKTTTGGNSVQNTHPFLSDNIAFCHNGTIKSFSNSETESDSHKFFIKIISDNNNFKKIYEETASNYDYTAMNMMFSDGNDLTVTRNWNENDPNAEKMEYSKYYTIYSFKTDSTVFVCSEQTKSLENLEKVLLENKSINIF
jgi:predicted glutamine amidotransferase